VKEVTDVLHLVFHFVWCWVIKVIVKGLEGSCGISWSPSINEQQHQEEGNWDDFCHVGDAVPIWDW